MNPLVTTVKEALQLPGLTPNGAAWLAKALHPSDAVLTQNGIPTLDAVPSAPLNFTSTVTISAPAAAAWSANVILAPTPLFFGKIATTTGAAYGSTTVVNGSLGVSNWAEFGAPSRTWHTSAMAALVNNVSSYRLCYASVTANLSASATSNEGTVTCAQYPLPSMGGFVAPVLNLGTPIPAATALCRFYDQTWRTQTQLQLTPGACTWEARKGMYSILKLDGNYGRWVKAREGEIPMAFSSLPASNTYYANTASAFDGYGAVAASATDVPFGPQSVWGIGAVSGTGATTNLTTTGVRVLQPSCENVSHIIFTGLDAAATISLTFRVGFEAVCQPESIYIGQVGAPVDYDPVALAAYFKVSREMLAAYPADYNIFGTLFNVIRGIGSAVGPTIARIASNISPTLGNVVRGIGNVLSSDRDDDRHAVSPIMTTTRIPERREEPVEEYRRTVPDNSRRITRARRRIGRSSVKRKLGARRRR